MKSRIFLSTLIGLFFITSSNAQQWNYVAPDIIHTNDNVGIGTSSPQAPFHINKDGTAATYPWTNSRGNILQLFEVDYSTLEIGIPANNKHRSWILSRRAGLAGNTGFNYCSLHLQPSVGNKSKYRGVAIGYEANEDLPFGTHLAVKGRVLIGDEYTLDDFGSEMPSDPDYKLIVDGNIMAEELKVQLSENWPDYVFQSDYHLLSLEEVEAHIQANGSLPNIPSAAEVEENGIAVGDMQRRTMEKVEELTLYLIDLKKENEALKQRIEKLENK